MIEQFELNENHVKVLDTIKYDKGFSTRQEALQYCITKFSKEILENDVSIEEIDNVIEEEKKNNSSKILGVESIDDLF